jgi:hypothetical protein
MSVIRYESDAWTLALWVVAAFLAGFVGAHVLLASSLGDVGGARSPGNPRPAEFAPISDPPIAAGAHGSIRPRRIA